MLAILLKSIEQGLGPLLSPASDIVFWLGIFMLAYVIFTPMLRVVVEARAARIGMEREWIMQCLSCRRVTAVAGPDCENCGRSLDIPWLVRIYRFFGNEGEARWLRTTRWIYTTVGVVVFLAVTATTLMTSGAWNPQSNIEKLFVGLSMLSWAGLGWLTGRVIGIGTGGPIARVRDAIFSLALATVFITMTTIAAAARPAPETVVAQVRIDGQVAQLGSQAVALVGYQLGFEYLQVEHHFAGFSRITPLAVVGARRIDLPLGDFESRLVDLLWKHANAFTARGLSVRKRTEQFVADQSGTYQIVLRGGEISIRLYLPPAS